MTYSKHLTALLTYFWYPWRAEYLSELREYHKCSKRSNSSKFINENGVVIINSIHRPFWRLSIVDKVMNSRGHSNVKKFWKNLQSS